MLKPDDIRNLTHLTDVQRQFILGGVLGDMCIRIPKRQRNPMLHIHHSIKQMDYVLYKYKYLVNLCKMKPKNMVCESFGKMREGVYFKTMSFPCLLPIHDIVMPYGYKTITDEWLNEITHPIALAAWYLDDGSLSNEKRKSGNIYTHKMRIALGDKTEEECETLKDWVKRRWGIDCIICNSSRTGIYKRIYKELRIYKIKNLIRMKSLIEPYVISSMKYKTNLIFKGET